VSAGRPGRSRPRPWRRRGQAGVADPGLGEGGSEVVGKFRGIPAYNRGMGYTPPGDYFDNAVTMAWNIVFAAPRFIRWVGPAWHGWRVRRLVVRLHGALGTSLRDESLKRLLRAYQCGCSEDEMLKHLLGARD
jgi:hypothetical protein